MELKHLTDADFDKEAKTGLAVVDFFATWCGPCKIFGPIIESASEEMKDVKFFKVDVDECEQTARQFGIMSIPTIVVLKDGQEVARNVGLMNRDDLLAFVEEHK